MSTTRHQKVSTTLQIERDGATYPAEITATFRPGQHDDEMTAKIYGHEVKLTDEEIKQAEEKLMQEVSE